MVWDLVKDVESVIKKDGNKTSEKRWVCRFCEKPFQEGPNGIQAHHGPSAFRRPQPLALSALLQSV